MRRESYVSRSEDETFAIGTSLAASLALGPGDVVLLKGNLGMGKTILARGLSAGLGVDAASVRSPTFTLVNPYRGRVPVYHIDLYRVDTPRDLEELGLEEILEGEGVALIEWAERLGPYRPEECVEIGIEDRGGNERRISVADARRRGHSIR